MMKKEERVKSINKRDFYPLQVKQIWDFATLSNVDRWHGNQQSKNKGLTLSFSFCSGM